MLQRVIELDQLEFPWPWTSDDWNNLCFDSTKTIYYYLNSLPNDHCKNNRLEQIIAFSLYQINTISKQAHLLKIIIKKDQRSRGLSKILLKQDIIYLRSKNLQNIYLEVEIDNLIGISLYKGFHFQKLNIIKQLYSNNRDGQAMLKLL